MYIYEYIGGPKDLERERVCVCAHLQVATHSEAFCIEEFLICFVVRFFFDSECSVNLSLIPKLPPKELPNQMLPLDPGFLAVLSYLNFFFISAYLVTF